MTIVEIEQNRNSLIDSLVKEENELLKKIEKSRKDDDYGLYKNLIRALTDVTTLKQKELANAPRDIWKDMYSHYYEGDKKIKGENEYVATWKQNYVGDIKEHRIFKVEKEIKKDGFLEDDVLDKIEDIIGYKVFGRKYGQSDSIGNVFNDISGAWDSISKDQQIEIIKLLNKQ